MKDYLKLIVATVAFSAIGIATAAGSDGRSGQEQIRSGRLHQRPKRQEGRRSL